MKQILTMKVSLHDFRISLPDYFKYLFLSFLCVVFLALLVSVYKFTNHIFFPQFTKFESIIMLLSISILRFLLQFLF